MFERLWERLEGVKRPLLITLAAIALLMTGYRVRQHYESWQALGPERIVAALPGVGAGWLDTLRRVAGPVTVDTLSKQTVGAYDDGEDESSTMLGVYESWHQLISVRTDLKFYSRFVRRQSGTPNPSHPLASAIPSGVVAHEFGHRFQNSLWPHGEVREAGDSLPSWAQDENEHFADRFARAMLALRGWDDPDPDDSMMNAVVRSRLAQSFRQEKQHDLLLSLVRQLALGRERTL